MKKICFIKHDMTDASGGARVAANLANELCKHFEVHVVSICSDKHTTFYPLDEKVKYHVLLKGAGRIRKVFFKGIKALKEYLKANDIDVAFSVGVSVNPFLIPATRGIRCRAVSCEHNNCLNEHLNDSAQRFCRYLGAKFAYKIVTLTRPDRDAYIKKYKLKESKVIDIHNWVDDILFEGNPVYNEDSKKIITVARLQRAKGIENIIEVSKELKKKHPDWSWDIYGGGEEDYVDTLKAMVKETGLVGYVNFMGNVSDIYDRYKDYALSVLTSYSEGFSLVLAEAKAKKVPCISYDCFVGPGIIVRDGVDGYLVPVGDTKKLEERIVECIENKDLRIKFSASTYGNMDLFKKETIVKKWIDFIQSI